MATDAFSQHKLASNETQEYLIDLSAKQAVDIDVEQLDGLVKVQWQDGAGNESTARVSDDGNHGHILVTIIAEEPGAWRLRVTGRKSQPAEYRIHLGTPRPNQDGDTERAAAGDALALAEELRNKGARANAVGAESAYREALEKFQRAKDGCGVRAALNGLAHLQIALQQYPAARASTERALAETCDDAASKAHSLRIFQSAVSRLGDLEAKISSGEQALTIYRETGDLGWQGLVLGNLSGAYAQEGATNKALEDAQQALDLARVSGDQDGVAFDEETLGAIHLQRGEYELALDTFNRTLDDLKAHPFPMVESMVANNLGNAQESLGDGNEALTAFRRAQQIAEKIGDASLLSDALIGEGSQYLSRRDYGEADKMFRDALGICVEKQFKRKQATSLRGLGAAEVGEGHFDSGMEKLTQAHELAHAVHDNFTEILAGLSLGDSYLSHGDFGKAYEAYDHARELATDSYTMPQLATSLANLARLKLASDDLAGARDNTEQALAIIEDQRTQINAPDLRSTFFRSTRGYYDLYIQVLMALERHTGDPAYARAALEAAENSRARALTDLLSERSINVRGAISEHLLRQRGQAEDELRAAAYRLNQLSRSASNQERDAAEASVSDAKRRLDQTEGAIRAENRGFSDLTRPDPFSVDEVQKQLLDSHSVILEFWLSEKESYLWKVTPDSLRSYRLPAGKQLDALASRLRQLLVSWPDVPPGQPIAAVAEAQQRKASEIKQRSAQLSEALLKPVLKELGDKDVAIVADGSLRGIPFDLLPVSSGKTLNSRNSVSYLPSVGTLRWLRREAYQGSLERGVAVFADPVFDGKDPRLVGRTSNSAQTSATSVARAMHDTSTEKLTRLVWSGREAESVSSHFPANKRWVALGFNANRVTALQAPWSQYGIAHFATHALIDSRNPELSGIVLSLFDKQGNSVDGFLRVTDIYNLNMPAQLVVLSTCDSAADSAQMENDVYTVVNAFFYAGSPRIIASLWAVDDRAGAAFMSRFYENLVLPGETPAMALRAAKTAMSRDPRWYAPYYWSGFVLDGDWH